MTLVWRASSILTIDSVFESGTDDKRRNVQIFPIEKLLNHVIL